MMLAIMPFSSEKDILFTAVRPPNRFTTSIVSRRAMGHFRLFNGFFCELAFAALCRDKAGWTENHHYDQDETEDQALIFGRIQLIGKISPLKVDDRDHRI